MKLMALLPFMDKDELKEFAKKIANGEVKGVSLAVVFPFLRKDDIDELVEDLIKGGNKKDIYAALPFLSKSAINTLYDRIQTNEIEGFRQEALLPFLGKDKIKEMFNELVKKAADEPVEDDISTVFVSEEE